MRSTRINWRACVAVMILSFGAVAAYAGPYEDGLGAVKRGDYSAAATLFRKAAEQGNANAQLNLGAMYTNGAGVPKDDQMAYFWFLLASAQGDEVGRKWRDLAESQLTPQQRAAAQAKARDWKPIGK